MITGATLQVLHGGQKVEETPEFQQAIQKVCKLDVMY